MLSTEKFTGKKIGPEEIDLEIENIIRETKNMYDRVQGININIQKAYNTTVFERFFLDVAERIREAANILKQ